MCITINAASLIKALLFSCFQKTKNTVFNKKRHERCDETDQYTSGKRVPDLAS